MPVVDGEREWIYDHEQSLLCHYQKSTNNVIFLHSKGRAYPDPFLQCGLDLVTHFFFLIFILFIYFLIS